MDELRCRFFSVDDRVGVVTVDGDESAGVDGAGAADARGLVGVESSGSEGNVGEPHFWFQDVVGGGMFLGGDVEGGLMVLSFGDERVDRGWVPWGRFSFLVQPLFEFEKLLKFFSVGTETPDPSLCELFRGVLLLLLLLF